MNKTDNSTTKTGNKKQVSFKENPLTTVKIIEFDNEKIDEAKKKIGQEDIDYLKERIEDREELEEKFEKLLEDPNIRIININDKDLKQEPNINAEPTKSSLKKNEDQNKDHIVKDEKLSNSESNNANQKLQKENPYKIRLRKSFGELSDLYKSDNALNDIKEMNYGKRFKEESFVDRENNRKQENEGPSK
jgi:hypothetical protein